jgi:general secretion pathway protein A
MLATLGSCPALEERIVVKCLVRPLQPAETADYIAHRLTMAGGRPTIFSEAAVNLVHGETGGYPRRINRICDLAMLLAFSEDCQQVDERHVRSVTHEIISLGGIAA